MADYPQGVELATYSWGTSFTPLGSDAVNASLTIKTVFGPSDNPTANKYLVWAATGAPFLPFDQSLQGNDGSFQLPVVDQPGFLNQDGMEVINWHYELTLRYTLNNQSVEITKTLYPLTGQDVQDLDTVLPSGESDPLVVVTSSVRTITVNATTYEPDANGDVDLGQLSSGGGGEATDTTARTSAQNAQTRADQAYTLADGKFTLPGTGIPLSLLASAVQSTLALANSAYQKPANGITTADFASAVVANLNLASTAVQPATLTSGLAGKADLVGGLIPTSQIPSLALTTAQVVASRAAMLALTPTQVQRGDLAVDTSTGSTRGTYILTADDPSLIANWTLLNTPLDVVQSVNGQQGLVVLGKADVGLGNVDNTSDLNKPISTAVQTALDAKATNATVTALTTTVNSKASQSDLNALTTVVGTKLTATLGAKGSTPPAGTPVGFYLTRNT